MVFDANPNAKLQTVQCPRWACNGSRVNGERPTHYVETELLTCADMPFEYCPSCPSLQDLSKQFIDKTKDGWYARMKRFEKDQEEDNE
jgi:hypothetical protein